MSKHNDLNCSYTTQPDEHDISLDDPRIEGWMDLDEKPPQDERVWVRLWPEDVPARVLDVRRKAPTSPRHARPTTASEASVRVPVPSAPSVLAGFEAWVADVARQAVEGTSAAQASDWIDQNQSPLGSRRHRKLFNQGKLPGRRDGKKVLVLKADLDAYILAQPAGHRPTPPAFTSAPEEDAEDEIDQELKALGLGRRS